MILNQHSSKLSHLKSIFIRHISNIKIPLSSIFIEIKLEFYRCVMSLSPSLKLQKYLSRSNFLITLSLSPLLFDFLISIMLDHIDYHRSEFWQHTKTKSDRQRVKKCVMWRRKEKKNYEIVVECESFFFQFQLLNLLAFIKDSKTIACVRTPDEDEEEAAETHEIKAREISSFSNSSRFDFSFTISLPSSHSLIDSDSSAAFLFLTILNPWELIKLKKNFFFLWLFFVTFARSASSFSFSRFSHSRSRSVATRCSVRYQTDGAERGMRRAQQQEFEGLRCDFLTTLCYRRRFPPHRTEKNSLDYWDCLNSSATRWCLWVKSTTLKTAVFLPVIISSVSHSTNISEKISTLHQKKIDNFPSKKNKNAFHFLESSHLPLKCSAWRVHGSE